MRLHHILAGCALALLVACADAVAPGTALDDGGGTSDAAAQNDAAIDDETRDDAETVDGDVSEADVQGGDDADASAPTDSGVVQDVAESDTDLGDTIGDVALPHDGDSEPDASDVFITDTGDSGLSDVATDAAADVASDAGVVPDVTPPLECPDGTFCADNTLCCAAGDVCLGNVCATPGDLCLDSFDCPDESFCEPVLGRCLPQPAELACEIIPELGDVSADVEWSYTAQQIISIPVVADLELDGIPDVVVNLSRVGAADWETGAIAALNGRTGELKWQIPHTPSENRYGSQGRSTIAVGDVSGDGLPDVIYASRETSNRSLIVAVDHTGATLWTSRTAAGSAVSVNVENGAITLANFDDDPMAEIVVGAMLLDHNGIVVWNQDNAGPGFGSNAGYIGGISVVVNLDEDETPEIISGRHAWDVSWVAGETLSVTVVELWNSGQADGYPAVADLDLNGTPEVVLVGSRNLVILNGADGTRWCGRGDCASTAELTPILALPGGASNNRGGPPTIADFDADGRPEIGIAGGYAYTVYDINRPGEEIVRAPGVAEPFPGAIYPRWTQTTQDLSSNATGSSVFDFQGDGAAEVVYADECFMRVYDGATGEVILQRPNSSATIHEYPIVVDVDADGNSEILVVANDAAGVQGCGSGYTTRRGLFVYGDPANQWMRTRRVWPQHAYHVTNATSVGNVPLVEESHWLLSGRNSYRQNVQGEGTYNAPDLQVSLEIDNDRCIFDELVINVTVRNAGSIGVLPGFPVRLYRGTDATGDLLTEISVTEGILPGTEIVVPLVIPVPTRDDENVFVSADDDGAIGGVVECDEGNNTAFSSLREACGT